MEINKKAFTPIKSGFTLTELMVVIGIIAFLGVLIVAYLRSQAFKGNDAKRKADLNRIGIAIEEYEKDNNCYPPPNLVTCENGGTGLKPYLEKIPCDPVKKVSYAYERDTTTACSKWYILYADLDNEKDNDYIPKIGPSSAYSFYYASPNAPEVVSNGIDVFYGCFSGACQIIDGPVCTPNYGASGCYGNCGTPQSPQNECVLN